MPRKKREVKMQLKNVQMKQGRFVMLDANDKRIWRMQHDWDNPPKNGLAQIVADDGTTSTLSVDAYVVAIFTK